MLKNELYLQKVQGVKSLNDNLLIHLYSSLVKYEGKIKVLEHKLDSQQKELRKLAEDNKKIKIEYTQKTNKMKSDHAEEINKIIKTEEKHTKEIKMLKTSLTTKQPITPIVGFHVVLSKNFAGSGKVPFDKILSNYGSGWNRIIHTFKVPRKGLYFLILTVMNYRESAHSWLMRGSTRVGHAWADGRHPYNVATIATVLLLDVGEHVYAQHGGGTIHSSDAEHYSYLAGFLIRDI